MWTFLSLFGKIFDILFYPFQGFSPWAGMIFISLLTGLFMLLVFRFTSNQEGIREVKDKIKAHLLELRLFKDSFSVSIRAQGNILRYNLKYIGYSAKPMLVMIVPLILIITQLNLWFGYQSLSPGERVIVKVKLKEGINPLGIKLSIAPSQGLEIETPPLRIEEEREIDWRLRADEEGKKDLVVIIDGEKQSKKLAISQKSLCRLSPSRVSKGILAQLLSPGEPPLPSDSPIEAIEVGYPSKNMNLLGWHIHWLIVYFALSIIFGFSLKGLFKVEI